MAAMRRWPAMLLLAIWPATAFAAGAADYYVQDLPGAPKDSTPIKMHAGHIEVDSEHNGNLFFWHFENKRIADKQRTVIWLNGGPGCSSEDGALMEIGPYRVKDEDNLSLNNGSWHEFANLLFVDNPVGTGFSYVDTDSYIHELDTMAEQFVVFLTKFFELFPHYEEDDIYIAGESYAGQHIPYIARAIMDRNKNEKRKWNLSGLLIGNGWISPRDHYDSYLPFAREKGLIKKDSEIDKEIEGVLRACKKIIGNNPGHVDYGECEDVLSTMLKLLKKGDGNDACVNMYDVRLKDSYPSCGMNWPPDLEHMAPYLRRKDVTSALHVNDQRNTGWRECNGAVGSAFTAKNSKPSIELLPDIMKEVPILLFSGAEDLICNHKGTETLISNLKWNDGKGFEMSPGTWAPRRGWTFEGEAAGFWQEARNLTYVQFYNASHMVPFDFPRRSRDMLDRFMRIDVRSIGGEPMDSRLDGEKESEVPSGSGKQDEKPSEDDSKQEVDDAKWEAYRRSGSVVLVIVVTVVSAWGYVIWRQRRKRTAYHALGESNGGPGLSGLRRKPGDGDLEAAAFDESELDDLHVETPTADKYSVGDDSDDDEGESWKNRTRS